MFPTFILLFIALICGAGASLSFAAYRRAKIAALKSPLKTVDVKGRGLKKAVEKAIKPHMERADKLEAELAKTNQLVADLKTAAELAPEPKGCGEQKKRGKKQNKKGSVK